MFFFVLALKSAYNKGMKKIIVALFLCFPVLAQALPAQPFQIFPNLEKVGSSDYGVLFIDVYDIDLYQDKENKDVDMLHLKYHMDLSAQRRINSLLKDMAKMPSLEKAPFKAWETQMQAFFPDVKDGDTITILRTPEGAAQFYYNDGLRAEIKDTVYTNAFFSVWLGEESPLKKIHKKLLKKAFHK